MIRLTLQAVSVQMADYTDMNAKKCLNHCCSVCSDKINKASVVVSVISLVLAALLSGLLFGEVDVVNKKAEAMETKLQNCVQRMEDNMDAKLQRIVQEIFQSTAMYARPTTGNSTGRNDAISGEFD